MAAKMHHQHLHAHQERGYVTEVSIVYVTAGPSAAGGGASAQQAAPSNSVAIGSPVQAGATATGGADGASSTAYPTYPNRPQRPPGANTSNVPVATTAVTSHGAGSHTTLVSAPMPTSGSGTFLEPSGNMAAQGGPSSTAAAAAAATTSSSASSSHTGGGLSPGAGAGIAVFVLAFVAAAGGLAYWIWRKRQAAAAAAHQRLDDEKSPGPGFNGSPAANAFASSDASVPRNPDNLAAPRLSLRPVTDMSFTSMQEKQAATAAGAATLAPVAVAAAAADLMRTRSAESAAAGNGEPVNPFGDDAATGAGPAPVKPMPPLGDSDPLKSWPARPTNAPVNGAAPASPGAKAPAGPGAGQPRGPPPNNVHRVQLDFKPTMDDELEIKAGQLVRMLHEYDDGWALCIRLDRSQQGVLPRNCLSKLPVKPRAPGNGPPPGQRGPPPARPAGPGSPPMNGPNQTRGRARSNAAEHLSSPGPFGQGQYTTNQGGPRSSSVGVPAPSSPSEEPSPVSSDPSSPVQGNAVPARKPVPGQAM